MTLHLRAIDETPGRKDALRVETFGPEDAMKKLPPKTEPGEPSEWDRHVTGAGRQIRIDFYLDDMVSMRKQARHLVELGRRIEMLCNDPSLTPRTVLLHVRHYAAVARELMERDAPSQQVRVLARRERLRRERTR